MTTISLAPACSGPLSPDHQQELLAANLRAKKIRGAIGVATFNAWSIAVFAILSLPFAIWSWPSFTLEVGLVVVAYNEFRGRNGLRRFDPAATQILGWNQIGLWALLVGYSVWSVGVALVTPNEYQQAVRANPDLGTTMLGSIGDLYLTVTLAVYGGLIVGATLMQGLNAWYYFTRQKHVQAYLDSTPTWVVDLQRAASI